MGTPKPTTVNMPEPKCGSKGCWGGSAVITLIIGGLLAIISMVVGGCDCAGETVCSQSNSVCVSYFDGCAKGDYDANACATYQLQNNMSCDTDACKYGGMDAGLMWAMFLIGITLLICGCVFVCCACACCCFGQDSPAGGPVAVAEVTE